MDGWAPVTALYVWREGGLLVAEGRQQGRLWLAKSNVIVKCQEKIRVEGTGSEAARNSHQKKR